MVQAGVWSDPPAAGGVPDHREPLQHEERHPGCRRRRGTRDENGLSGLKNSMHASPLTVTVLGHEKSVTVTKTLLTASLYPNIFTI